MKKYQLWLQRKSYSQHLFNLMKIKNAKHSLEKVEQPARPPRPPTRQQSTLTRYKQFEESQQSVQKLGDISYAITYKQLKNRKMRIMKTFEILNQNMSMSRRINGVKSALHTSSHNKAMCDQRNNKRKLFEKKCELSNEEIRQQNFKKFMRWQNNRSNPFHHYILTLTVQSITKLMSSHHQYAAAWCEIVTDKGVVRSELIPLDQFQGHKIPFSLDTQFPKECLFRLYVCKSLDSEFIGQFQFQRPELSQHITNSYRSDDGQFGVILKMDYNRIRKQKFIFNLK